MFGDIIALVTSLVSGIANLVLLAPHHVPQNASLIPGKASPTAPAARQVPLIPSLVSLLTNVVPLVTRPVPLLAGQVSLIRSGTAPAPTLVLASRQTSTSLLISAAAS